jgi:hypothetical protein
VLRGAHTHVVQHHLPIEVTVFFSAALEGP